MAADELDFGDSVAGLLVDGVDETPYVAATLKMTRDEGVILEVPYHDAAPEYGHVASWFKSQRPPENLVLQTSSGDICLFNLQSVGRTTSMRTGAAIGRLAPGETVLAPRDAPVSTPLTIQRAASRLDGLNMWSGLLSEDHQAETDDQGRLRQLTVTLRSPEDVTWRQGTATLTLRATWQAVSGQDGYARHTAVSDNVVVESEFDDGPHPFADHFVEHRKLAILLRLLYGRPISFRVHSVRDVSFAIDIGMETPHFPTPELISAATVRERGRPIPAQGELGQPIVYLAPLGAEALATWSDKYEAWTRFIAPAASVLGRADPFVEDVVNSTNMSMEAAGQLIGPQPGEEVTWSRKRPTTKTYVYRCLKLLDIDWGDRVASLVGLATAVADSYNTLKHPDRGPYADAVETMVVASIGRLVVRYLAVHVSGRNDLLSSLRDTREVLLIRQDLINYGLRIDDKGHWTHEQ